ncbi:MAG: hypothetical protein QOE45_273 [Frankiaceae bacterium]|jgi:hypothetical protein|nr:hypothetical protein [Frankiaceae bacterium]
MTLTTTEDRWRGAFAALDRQCPWPGPRPLGEDDVDRFQGVEHVLIGRDRDRTDFLREVDTDHRLIFLTGPSGVGKTSLLQVGLVPVLRENGYRVAVCRDWTREDRQATPAAFLASKVRGQLAEAIPDLAEGPELFWDLEDRGQGVLVLDQFEELLRWDPQMRDGLFALIADLNRATRIKIVVSFRREFLHEMRPLENVAKAFSMSHFPLEPLDPRFALELVTAPNARGRQVVTPGAAATIAAYWREAVDGSADGATQEVRGGVGLLHLQALLYALHASAPGGVITQEVLDAFGAKDAPVELFVVGLVRAAEVKLERCRRASAAEGLDLDDYLLEGTTALVARSVRHLSSAGYKLVRELVELAEVTLGDQLACLTEGAEETGGEISPERLRALFTVLVDTAFGPSGQVAELLRLDRAEIARRADSLGPDDVVTTWVRQLEPGGPNADPTGATSGAMLGMPAAAVLIEEIRRFVFALVWLQESSLARVSRPGRDTMVSLVHDGFGTALAAWSASVLERPMGTIYALTAPRGAYLRWQSEAGADPPADFDGQESTKVLANLRWRGNTVQADFTNVSFVNCDLRGTLFLQCTLAGVAFVNCMLDGAMFSDCVIRGALAAASGAWTPHEPSFFVPAPASLLAALARYRDIDGPLRWLFSPSQGRPAVPVFDPPAQRDDFLGEVAGVRGGMAIFGGRLSSFVMRRCTVEPGSMVSFRHVAGSGLDVVEQTAGCYEIFGSALRHVSFTTTRKPGDEDQVDIRADKSVLAQVWFGDPVRGSFTASDCRLVQVWNGSPYLVATAASSPVTGCVDVRDIDGSCPPIGEAEGLVPMKRIDATDDLRSLTRRMDYRVY